MLQPKKGLTEAARLVPLLVVDLHQQIPLAASSPPAPAAAVVLPGSALRSRSSLVANSLSLASAARPTVGTS